MYGDALGADRGDHTSPPALQLNSPEAGHDHTSPPTLQLGDADAGHDHASPRMPQPGREIDSMYGMEPESANSSNVGFAAPAAVAIPETKNISGGGGGGPPDGWADGLVARRRRAYVGRSTAYWLLHFLQALVLSIIVILLLVAVSVPVSDHLMPSPGDYTKMKFDWKVDPRSYLTPMNASFSNYNVLLDAHLHTTYSDGSLSPKQVVEYALANGYNAIIVTDHQTIEGSIAARDYALEHHRDEIVVITGMEYSCCRIHMNLIGINESVTVSPPFPSDDELRSVIKKVHDIGGLVIVNHIPWSNATVLPWGTARLPDNPTREQLLDWGVDGFEVVNQDIFDLRTYQFIQAHADRLVGVTGSDMHVPGPTYAWTTINARNRTAEAILAEIRGRRTSFLLDASGTREVQDPPYKPTYFSSAPWGLLGQYFYGYADRYRGMYSFQGTFCQNHVTKVHGSMVGWLFLWLLVSIVVLECLYWLCRWLVLAAVRWVRGRRAPAAHEA
ncbi:hypothetical protein H4R18_002438 [Coemansia javaensis]|uniref:Polymerase/histidinol phosphatase N-terminal domain-containing protein n=1 Tax=Coemansia javaensis TaxID=2761396 RepID=A0A9W8H9P4_9FUNG|nr:hypothetical protein H4R18_002438 [Coemansia javaensis]